MFEKMVSALILDIGNFNFNSISMNENESRGQTIAHLDNSFLSNRQDAIIWITVIQKIIIVIHVPTNI